VFTWNPRPTLRTVVGATALAVAGTTVAAVGTSSATTETSTRAAAVSWYLAPGQTLASGKWLLSPNRAYLLGMQTDGNLVLRRVSDKKALWHSRTYGQPGARLVLQTNGNLVIWRGSQPVWSTRTAGRMLRLAVQNNGQLVLYTESGAIAWTQQMIYERLTAPNIIARGQALFTRDRKYALGMQLDGNLVLYQGRQGIWSTRTNGRTGTYAQLHKDGNFVLIQNGRAIWSTRTSRYPGAVLVIQPGNVVLYHGGRAIWRAR
jgi:hypothetical protein